MNLFKAVKENVTARQAAEMCGLKVSGSGMACCPFHDDHHPSMKLDERYYCFGCQATGDAIDFVAAYLHLSSLEAAKRLAHDFGVPYTEHGQPIIRAAAKESLQAQQEKKAFTEWKRKTLSDLAEIYRILEDCKEAYVPMSREESWPPLFIQSCNDQILVDLYTYILENASEEDQRSLWAESSTTIGALASRAAGVALSNDRRHRMLAAPAI